MPWLRVGERSRQQGRLHEDAMCEAETSVAQIAAPGGQGCSGHRPNKHDARPGSGHSRPARRASPVTIHLLPLFSHYRLGNGAGFSLSVRALSRRIGVSRSPSRIMPGRSSGQALRSRGVIGVQAVGENHLEVRGGKGTLPDAANVPPGLQSL
jgi:hypothetical protein